MNVEPISEQKSSGCGGLAFGLIFGGIFFLAGAFFFWMTFLNPLLRTQGSDDWLETQCTVITSELDVDHDDDGTTYRPRIEFEYTVGKLPYTSDEYDFTALNRTKVRCKEIIAAYPVGKEVSCFVDPDSHDTAVIVRDYDFSVFGCLFPLVFVLIGLAVGLGSFFYKGNNSNSISGSAKAPPDIPQSDLSVSSFSSGSYSVSSSSHPADIEDNNWDVPKTLKPSQRRTTTFLLTALFTLFWNGIVSIFVYGIIKDGLNGGFDFLGVLFMIPFVLVGLGLIGGAVYTLAAIFNPKVELALSTGAVERGGSFDVAWQLSGRTSIVNSVKVTIEGEESATYRRGTDTITATNVFCSMPIAEVTESQDIEFGSVSATIPADTMHTFSADRNKILWRITVVGDIPYWPDIKETYEFRVKP